jgi:hypothetical protein
MAQAPLSTSTEVVLMFFTLVEETLARASSSLKLATRPIQQGRYQCVEEGIVRRVAVCVWLYKLFSGTGGIRGLTTSFGTIVPLVWR